MEHEYTQLKQNFPDRSFCDGDVTKEVFHE